MAEQTAQVQTGMGSSLSLQAKQVRLDVPAGADEVKRDDAPIVSEFDEAREARARLLSAGNDAGIPDSPNAVADLSVPEEPVIEPLEEGEVLFLNGTGQVSLILPDGKQVTFPHKTSDTDEIKEIGIQCKHFCKTISESYCSMLTYEAQQAELAELAAE